MGRMIMIMRVFSLMTNTMVGMKKTQSCTVSRNNDHPEHDADDGPHRKWFFRKGGQRVRC